MQHPGQNGRKGFLKSFSIGKKLYLSFGILVFLLAVTSVVAIVEMEEMTAELVESEQKYMPISDNAMKIEIELLTARRHEKDFLARNDAKYLTQMENTLARFDTHVADIDASVQDLGISAIAQNIDQIRASRTAYETAFNKVADLIRTQGDKSAGIRGELRGYAHQLESAIEATPSPMLMNALTVHYLMLRRHEKDFILRHDAKYVEEARKVVTEFEGLEDESIFTNAQKYVDTLARLADNVFAYEAEYPVMRKAGHDIESSAKKIEEAIAAIIAERQERVESLKHTTFWFVSGLSAITVVLGVILAFFAVRAITKPIRRIIAGLNDGADQVASASSQVSASSQQLAEGSSEQAAAIEETSSSLEEMSAMTQQNADNANQANSLMTDANHVVEQANAAMADLTKSMGDISKASEETQKIVKTIDEIAFQTNLLALNAAVEAARAGEAGAGFAVVADEVRNLAMRAADAAKNTAELIDDTVKKINDGSTVVVHGNEAFQKVSGSSRKVGDLVSEIAAASSEQAQGIHQVNTAVSEMGQVTQQNAANAEESASASEEMSAQAEQMKAMVDELVTLVEGSNKNGAGMPMQAFLERRTPSLTATPATRKGESNLDQLIPMESDEAFGDF